jgi:hypothetical protein
MPSNCILLLRRQVASQIRLTRIGDVATGMIGDVGGIADSVMMTIADSAADILTTGIAEIAVIGGIGTARAKMPGPRLSQSIKAIASSTLPDR